MLSMFPFIRDDVLPSWWANAIQKRLSVGASGFVISKLSPTQIQVVAGADAAAAILDIAGKWRWNEATVNRAHPGGAAATFDIFVTAKANDIRTVPAVGSDFTDYSFALAIVAHNATPAIVAGVVDIFRKVGELEWSGAAITSITQLVGAPPAPANGAGDAVEALRALGLAAGQAMPGVTKLNGISAPNGSVAMGGQKLTGLAASTVAGDAVRHEDARLADARTPTAHAATHRAGGSDPLSAAALSLAAVLDVGQVGQLRAGRTLAPTDFTTLFGLAAPAGLWNLSDLTDASGNGRNLTNKGAVPFGAGILGAASTAAVFAGSTAQALYLNDTGAADPFRIKVGSVGCWFRTAKRGLGQYLVTKALASGSGGGFLLNIAGNAVSFGVALTNVGFAGTVETDRLYVQGSTDVADDRWHHAVGTWDGTTVRLYVDGQLEAAYTPAAGGPMFGGAAPLNIGGYGADAATATAGPHFGRADEAFVTPDVLSEDQVRLLMAAKFAHGLAVTPARMDLMVTRRRRGGALATADFPTPASLVRGHNFAAGSLADFGANAQAVVLNPGAGAIVAVSAPDGSRDSAYGFSGAHTGASATDAGLPAGTSARSYGMWLKTNTWNAAAGNALLGWGTLSTGDARLVLGTNGQIATASAGDIAGGPFICDGQWHFVVAVEDNAAADGVKRKVYMDGRLVASSTVLNAIVLAGAGRFRVGANPDGSGNPLIGQAARPFVYAGALTPEQVAVLWQKSALSLPVSPKNSGDHVEAVDATNVYALFDSLDANSLLDLKAAA